MKIGIDCRAVTAAGLGRGLGIYTANLAQYLAMNGAAHQFVLFCSHRQRTVDFFERISQEPNVTLCGLTRPTRAIFFWDQVCWYTRLQRERIDLFHSPVYGVPLFCPCQRVLTIHDLTPLLFPEAVQKLRHKAVFRFNFFTGTYAEHIITSSYNSKHDIMRCLHIPEEKITVIPDGVGEQYRVVHEAHVLETVRDRYHIPGRFLLYVGGFDRNKNLVALLQAFRRLLENYPGLKETLSLVFTGALTPAADTLRALSREWGLERSVIFTGFAPEEDLIRLYNAAEVFVFPSLYEGFGLPPLEAMACGTPVICSKAASLPEVVGDAAVQVSPDSPAELASAIYDVLSNPQLQEKMRRHGLERARRFSWNNTVSKTLQVYAEVFRQRKPSSS